MILTSKDIDRNEKLVGRRIKLVKEDNKLSDFAVGDITTCLELDDDGDMLLQSSLRLYSYPGEEWELLDDLTPPSLKGIGV